MFLLFRAYNEWVIGAYRHVSILRALPLWELVTFRCDDDDNDDDDDDDDDDDNDDDDDDDDIRFVLCQHA